MEKKFTQPTDTNLSLDDFLSPEDFNELCQTVLINDAADDDNGDDTDDDAPYAEGHDDASTGHMTEKEESILSNYKNRKVGGPRTSDLEAAPTIELHSYLHAADAPTNKDGGQTTFPDVTCTRTTLCLVVHVNPRYHEIWLPEHTRLYAFDATLRTSAFAFGSGHNREIAFLMKPETVWLESRYTLVLNHDKHPLATCSLTLDASGIRQGAWSDILDPASMPFRLGILGQQIGFQILGTAPGMAGIRRRVVELYGDTQADDYFDKAGLPVAPARTGIVISTCGRLWPYCFGHVPFPACLSTVLAPDSGMSCYDAHELVTVNAAGEPCETLSQYVPDSIAITQADLLTGGQEGPRVVDRLIGMLSAGRHWLAQLCTATASLDRLFTSYPSLARFFPAENRLSVAPFTPDEFIVALIDEVSDYVTDAAAARLAKSLRRLGDSGRLRGWTVEMFDAVVRQAVMTPYRSIAARQSPGWDESVDGARVRSWDSIPPLHAAALDLTCLAQTLCADDAFRSAMAGLYGMTGLATVKAQMERHLRMLQFEAQRRSLGLKTLASGPGHMIFTGNPGTGKTTVARMIGRIYKALGLLSKGDVLMMERSIMVGRYIGQTEENMTHILSMARGNVLFIDEAYTLYDGASDRKDFGRNVLDALLTLLSEPNPDVVVIMAGYKDRMDEMLQSNDGLRGRFAYHIDFPDYTAGELIQIAEGIITCEQYVLTDAARRRLAETIREAVSRKDSLAAQARTAGGGGAPAARTFHNARWVSQYVRQGILPAMADRLLDRPLPTADAGACQRIEVADVDAGFRLFAPFCSAAVHAPRHVGFCA